jgi:ATP-binding cassette subfamily B protein
MPRQYRAGGRASGPAGPAGPQGPPGAAPPPQSFRDRVGALRNLPPFLALIWETARTLTVLDIVLRLARALLPVITLYIGKLIVDEVVRLSQLPGAPGDLRGWIDSGLLAHLGWLVALEFGLAVLSDVLGRVVSLIDSLISERFTNATSVRLMEHAATLDLEDFEDSELQDRLERARRQTMGRTTLMTQIFGQAQDVVTILAFAAGQIVYAPWLIAL